MDLFDVGGCCKPQSEETQTSVYNYKGLWYRRPLEYKGDAPTPLH